MTHSSGWVFLVGLALCALLSSRLTTMSLDLIQNSQAVIKCAAPVVKKRCEIQIGNQEMAVMVG